jgi:hypothetical protein
MLLRAPGFGRMIATSLAFSLAAGCAKALMIHFEDLSGR